MERNRNWILKIDGENDRIGAFKTLNECVDEALRLISERFVNIEAIIDDVLKQKHTKTCHKLIENLRDIRNLRTADVHTAFEDYLGDEVECIEENSFLAEWNCGTIFSVSFGSDRKALFIETNIWEEKAESYFLFIRTKTDRIKYSFLEVSTIPSYANIFLVYQALTTIPQSRKEIQETIFQRYGLDQTGYECSGYDCVLSEDTISNQIHALRRLGIPVYERRLAPKDRECQGVLMEQFGNEYKEGFYLDYSRPLVPDYAKCKNREKIMLVYLTLKEIDKEHAIPTQQAIIDAVYDKFGVKLQRQKVKNYIDVLSEFNASIRYDEAGYWMK